MEGAHKVCTNGLSSFQQQKERFSTKCRRASLWPVRNDSQLSRRLSPSFGDFH